MSDANRVSIKYVPETVYGTTPADSADWQALRFTSSSLAAAPQTVISNELRSDRMVTDLIKVGEQVSGEIAIEHSMTSFDDLLEAALLGTWDTDVLEVGTTERSFTLEVGYEDWTPAQYLSFNGMRVGAANLTFPYGAVVTGGFTFAGKEAAASTVSLVGLGSVTAAPTTDVVNGSSDVSSILLDGGAPGSIIKTISLSLDNTLRPVEGIGSAGPSDQAYGRAMITGSIEMYFDDITAYNKLIANATSSLQWTVGDGVNTQTFLLPRIKFNDGQPDVSGVDTDVMITLNFTALYDSVEGTSMRITRA